MRSHRGVTKVLVKIEYSGNLGSRTITEVVLKKEKEDYDPRGRQVRNLQGVRKRSPYTYTTGKIRLTRM